MGENSKIEWTDHTFNPWIGCTKVHAGCAHCYAESLAKRTGQAQWGPGGTRVKTSEKYWQQPLKWNREAACIQSFDCRGGQHSDACPQSQRPRVFCASLADVFEDWQGPMLGSDGAALRWIGGRDPVTMSDVRSHLFGLIDQTPNLDWLLLTKRPENIRRMWAPKADKRPIFPGAPGKLGEPIECVVSNLPRPNVWLGTSISDQATADEYVYQLLRAGNLAAVRFLSIEPLLGPIDLIMAIGEARRRLGTLNKPGTPNIDWGIVGGESGHHARPMHPDWVRSLRDQCVECEIAFHFKQWGEWAPSENHPFVRESLPWFPGNCCGMSKVGKAAAGRLLDGRTWEQYPEVAHA